MTLTRKGTTCCNRTAQFWLFGGWNRCSKCGICTFALPWSFGKNIEGENNFDLIFCSTRKNVCVGFLLFVCLFVFPLVFYAPTRLLSFHWVQKRFKQLCVAFDTACTPSFRFAHGRPAILVISRSHRGKKQKSFRKKLTKRPLALRCQTQYTQAHDLGGIAMRYLDCVEGTFPWKSDNSWNTAPLPSILQLRRLGMISLETPPHASLEKFSVPPLPFCGWAYVEKEKGSLACLPSYFEARCHCRGVQEQRSRTLGHH